MARRVYSEATDRIEDRDPVVVSRYPWYTRLNHWVLAITFILLALSGLALFHPYFYGLTGLFGGGQTARWLHPILGLVLSVSFLLIFLQLWSYNIMRREDLTWASNIGDVVTGHEERLPELGKYNLGQKMVFWGMFWMILLLLLSGLAIWQEQFPHLVDIPTRRIAMLTHSLAAVVILLVFILHVFAALWTRGTLRAMSRGSVTGGWAWRHHRKWLREVARRQDQGPAE